MVYPRDGQEVGQGSGSGGFSDWTGLQGKSSKDLDYVDVQDFTRFRIQGGGS